MIRADIHSFCFLKVVQIWENTVDELERRKPNQTLRIRV